MIETHSTPNPIAKSFSLQQSDPAHATATKPPWAKTPTTNTTPPANVKEAKNNNVTTQPKPTTTQHNNNQEKHSHPHTPHNYSYWSGKKQMVVGPWSPPLRRIQTRAPAKDPINKYRRCRRWQLLLVICIRWWERCRHKWKRSIRILS